MKVGDRVESERGPAEIVGVWKNTDPWDKARPGWWYIVELDERFENGDPIRFLARPDQLQLPAA